MPFFPWSTAVQAASGNVALALHSLARAPEHTVDSMFHPSVNVCCTDNLSSPSPHLVRDVSNL